MKNALNFEIKTRLAGTLARTGETETPHGKIKTPAYIAGGTNATVKAMTPEQILSTGAQAVLANTYHLMLRPGADILAAAGGVVVTQQFHPEYGNMIEIDHGNQLITRYAHTSRTFVKQGDIVRRGQKIAEIGTTGRSTGPSASGILRADPLANNSRPPLRGGTSG